MGASAHKMVTLYAVLAIVLSTLGQPTMADPYGRSGVACPSTATTCLAECIPACDTFSTGVCEDVCHISLPVSPLGGLGHTCVSQAFTACIGVCKNLCEPLPVQTKINP